jgi:hypothetical protein
MGAKDQLTIQAGLAHTVLQVDWMCTQGYRVEEPSRKETSVAALRPVRYDRYYGSPRTMRNYEPFIPGQLLAASNSLRIKLFDPRNNALEAVVPRFRPQA